MKIKQSYIVFIIFVFLQIFGFNYSFCGNNALRITLPQNGLVPNSKVERYIPEMSITLPDTIACVQAADGEMLFVSESYLVYLTPMSDETKRLNSMLNDEINISYIPQEQWIGYLNECDSIFGNSLDDNGIKRYFPKNKKGIKINAHWQGAVVEKNGFKVVIWAKGEALGKLICMISEDFKIENIDEDLVRLLLQIEKVNESGRLTEKLYLMYWQFKKPASKASK